MFDIESGDTEDTVITEGLDDVNDDTTSEDATEAEADASKGDEDSKSKDGTDTEADKKEVAPETYGEFNLPEGMDKNGTLLEEALPIFKELDLTQEQAQKLVDFQTKSLIETSAQQADAWTKTMKEWVTTAKDDKEIGGKEFEANIAIGREAIKTYANEGFREMLNVTGVGNHPEMIRFLVKVGKAVSDDKILQGGKAAGPVDPAKVLYPDMN